MKNTIKMLACAASLAVLGTATAADLHVQTGFSDAGSQASAGDYMAVVEAAVAVPGAGYGSAMLASLDNFNNQSLFGGVYYNIAFKTTVNFGLTSASNMAFRAGVDFGNGGAVYLDGVAMAYNPNDMWWNGSYGDTSQSFQFSSSLAAGNHTLTIYGLEGCCDGPQQVQFNTGDGFQSFTNQTLAPVPEPETYAMLAAGLGVVGFSARRRKA